MKTYAELRAEYEEGEKHLDVLRAEYEASRERSRALRQRNTDGLAALAMFMFCAPLITICGIVAITELLK